jgi:predicted GH43/DUF377 family glycosyl hydrolase
MKIFAAPFVGLCLCALSWSASCAEEAAADWTLGPFTRPVDAQPVIRPDPASVFYCPMRKAPVNWESRHTFNPAAIVKDGKVCVLYRAEDNSGKGIGRMTSRLGLAESEDGIHFTKRPEPVLFPAEDEQKDNEWEGGCEDPRVVETEDGTYVLLYTQFARDHGGAKLGLATSKDLLTWSKRGPISVAGPDGRHLSPPHKSASLVCKVSGDRLVAAKINGRYWLYVGEGGISLLSSADLNTWTRVAGAPLDKLDSTTTRLRGSNGSKDNAAFLLAKRQGKFDSGFPECGPPALLTDKGIILLYNGKNGKLALNDIGVGPGAYSGGQALFSAADPSQLLDRTDTPFIQPELPWEKSGQYQAGTTFIEGLVLFKGRWFLYYGCADTFVGVATAPVRAGQTHATQ